MKSAKLLMFTLFSISVLTLSVSAQVDQFGKTDTVYIELEKLSPTSWALNISITNDEDIEALSIPFKMTAGLNKIVADSAVYVGGRVEKFTLKAFRADTALQSVTLGMVANLGPTNNVLAKGRGRLVTVFVSSLENKEIKMITIDTTTTHPNNSLMVVASTGNWGDVRLDTITIEQRKTLEIIPVFIVREIEK